MLLFFVFVVSAALPIIIKFSRELFLYCYTKHNSAVRLSHIILVQAFQPRVRCIVVWWEKICSSKCKKTHGKFHMLSPYQRLMVHRHRF